VPNHGVFIVPLIVGPAAALTEPLALVPWKIGFDAGDDRFSLPIYPACAPPRKPLPLEENEPIPIVVVIVPEAPVHPYRRCTSLTTRIAAAPARVYDRRRRRHVGG